MNQAAKTYGKVANKISNPRELEADLLLDAARRLQMVRDAWTDNNGNLGPALNYNRKLWTFLISAVTNNDNPLPREIRQNIANIGIFVLKQTVEMQTNPDPAKLKSLIDINCNIAAGLSGRA